MMHFSKWIGGCLVVATATIATAQETPIVRKVEKKKVEKTVEEKPITTQIEIQAEVIELPVERQSTQTRRLVVPLIQNAEKTVQRSARAVEVQRAQTALQQQQAQIAAQAARKQLDEAKRQLQNQQLTIQLEQVLSKFKVEDRVRKQIVKELQAKVGPQIRIVTTAEAKSQPTQYRVRVVGGDDASYRIGINSSELNEALRSQLNLEHGVVVDRVSEGQPAAKAGVRRFDVLVDVDGKAIEKIDVLNQAIQVAGKSEKAVTLHVIRAGKKLYIDVKPEQRKNIEYRLRNLQIERPQTIYRYQAPRAQYVPTPLSYSRVYTATQDKSVIDYLKSLDRRLSELQKAVDNLQKKID